MAEKRCESNANLKQFMKVIESRRTAELGYRVRSIRKFYETRKCHSFMQLSTCW